MIINNGTTGMTGYGRDFSWGTVKITALSSLTGSPKPYMFYGDNPAAAEIEFLVRPHDDDRLSRPMEPLEPREPQLLALLPMARHLPRSADVRPKRWE